MKKLVLALCTIATLAIAPSAFACAECIWPNCDFLGGHAAFCWEEPEGEVEPGGCFTTGRCWPPGGAQQADLGTTLTIASVEVRQGGSVTVTTPQPVVAEVRPAAQPSLALNR